MKKSTYYHLYNRDTTDHGNPDLTARETVLIRDKPPRLLPLFPWEFTKGLTQDDVANCHGMELSAEQVYAHIFKYWDEHTVSRVVEHGEQVPIVVWDMNTGTDHNLMLKGRADEGRFWVYCGWITDFVARRGLKEGMTVGMYWNIRRKSLGFSVINTEV